MRKYIQSPHTSIYFEVLKKYSIPSCFHLKNSETRKYKQLKISSKNGSVFYV